MGGLIVAALTFILSFVMFIVNYVYEKGHWVSAFEILLFFLYFVCGPQHNEDSRLRLKKFQKHLTNDSRVRHL